MVNLAAHRVACPHLPSLACMATHTHPDSRSIPCTQVGKHSGQCSGGNEHSHNTNSISGSRDHSDCWDKLRRRRRAGIVYITHLCAGYCSMCVYAYKQLTSGSTAERHVQPLSRSYRTTMYTTYTLYVL